MWIKVSNSFWKYFVWRVMSSKMEQNSTIHGRVRMRRPLDKASAKKPCKSRTGAFCKEQAKYYIKFEFPYSMRPDFFLINSEQWIHYLLPILELGGDEIFGECLRLTFVRDGFDQAQELGQDLQGEERRRELARQRSFGRRRVRWNLKKKREDFLLSCLPILTFFT